jgi:uncharacterized membrane protein
MSSRLGKLVFIVLPVVVFALGVAVAVIFAPPSRPVESDD